MEPVIPMQAIIAEFLNDDALIRMAAARYQAWLERQQWVIQTLRLFPDAFKGTPLENWEPLMVSMNVFQGAPSAASPNAFTATPVSTPPDSLEASSSSVRRINSSTADLAFDLFTEAGHLMKADALDAALRQRGWVGFPYLQDQSLDQSKWTLYRVLQSRPNTFALFGEGRWGLLAWKKTGIPNQQEAP